MRKLGAFIVVLLIIAILINPDKASDAFVAVATKFGQFLGFVFTKLGG